MSEEFEYEGVWFQITHLPEVGLYQAISEHHGLPVALTISSSTLMGLLAGIKSAVGDSLEAGAEGEAQVDGSWGREQAQAETAVEGTLHTPRFSTIRPTGTISEEKIPRFIDRGC